MKRVFKRILFFNDMEEFKGKRKFICSEKDCNNEVERYYSGIKSSKEVFCSHKCSSLGKHKGKTIICTRCSKEFYRAKSDLIVQVNQFCGRECHHAYRRENPISTTNSYKTIRGEREHVIIAQDALKRLLRKGEVVHHIDENIHNNAIDNLAVFPNQRFHMKVHRSIRNINFDHFRLTHLMSKVK